MPQVVRYHDWELEVDVDATSAAYSLLASGEAEGCRCIGCLNWIEQRDNVFPGAFLSFVQELGINFRKETEISEYEDGAVDSHMNLYTGEFLFCGRVISGSDCFAVQPDKRGATVVLDSRDGILVGVSSNVKWAMTGPATAVFPQATPRAVVVFQVRVPRGHVYHSERQR